jgi:hypothetical protein
MTMTAKIGKDDGPQDLNDRRGIHITGNDGAQWVIRADEQFPNRLEVMLVPGTGPKGESDVSVRPKTGNRVTVEAVGW